MAKNFWPREKFFKAGHKLPWGFYCNIGSLQCIKETNKVYVAEGFATAMSIANITKKTVLIAFTKDNLDYVVSYALQKWPLAKVGLCLDYDIDKITGQDKTHKTEIKDPRLKVIKCDFPGKDFNDTQGNLQQSADCKQWKQRQEFLVVKFQNQNL